MLKDPEPALTATPDSFCLDLAKMGPKCVLDRFDPVTFADSDAKCQKLFPSPLTILLTQQRQQHCSPSSRLSHHICSGGQFPAQEPGASVTLRGYWFPKRFHYRNTATSSDTCPEYDKDTTS